MEVIADARGSHWLHFVLSMSENLSKDTVDLLKANASSSERKNGNIQKPSIFTQVKKDQNFKAIDNEETMTFDDLEDV